MGKKYKKSRKINPLSIEFQDFLVSSCTSKKRYDTEFQAKFSADWVRDTKGKTLHCYYCKHCGGYHLTESNEDFDGNKVF